MPCVDAAYYEEIAGLLHGLLIRLDDRLPGKDITLIAEFIDANELGLALDQLADVLSEDKLPLARDERADMLARSRIGRIWVIGFLMRFRAVPRDDGPRPLTSWSRFTLGGRSGHQSGPDRSAIAVSRTNRPT
jgi:hypothetical protein